MRCLYVVGVVEAESAGHGVAPVAALCYCERSELKYRDFWRGWTVWGTSVPYLSYPNFNINLLHTSAYLLRVKSLRVTPEEKPKLGREGATTWKAGCPSPPFKRGRSFVTSRKEPGPGLKSEACYQIDGRGSCSHPWLKSNGIAPFSSLTW